MKRLAVLALTAGVGLPATAADPTPLPAPTALAPTRPMVPSPFAGPTVVSPTAPRAEARAEAGGMRARLAGMFRRAPEAEPYDPYPAKKAWCTDCAPAARQPLPPLPAGLDMGAYGVRPAVATATAPVPPPPPAPPVVGGCADGHCPTPGRASGSCWDCFKRWLCFRNTPVHLPHIPTQRPAPQWTYGVCREGPGCAGKAVAGCADGRCGLGLGAGGKSGAAVAGCAPCPAPGEVVMPGYRLANPESPGMTAPRAAGPVVNPVAPAGYKAPAATVPYKGGTVPTQQRPFIGQ